MFQSLNIMLESTLTSSFFSKITIKYKTQFLYLMGAFILLSMAINQPFLTISFAPRLPRLALEGLILIILISIYAYKLKNKVTSLSLIILVISLGISYFLNQEDLMTATPKKAYEAPFFILPQLFLVGFPASITKLQNKSLCPSELGSDRRKLAH